MKWDSGRLSCENLCREARRLRECSSESWMSNVETEAFSLALWEIGQAIAGAQEHPVGHERSLSQECIDLFLKAAKMAENERRSKFGFGTYLPPMAGAGAC